MAYIDKADSSRPLLTQTISASTTAASTTNAFSSETYQIRVLPVGVLAASNTVNIFIGTTAATTSDLPILTTWPEYFTVTPGQKLSAIMSSTTATIFVTEMT